MVAAFSKLTGGPERKVASLLKNEAKFLLGIDELFDVFCDKLRMADKDYSFEMIKRSPRIAKCLDVPLPLTSSDKQFIRRSQTKPNFASSSACPSEVQTDVKYCDPVQFRTWNLYLIQTSFKI